MGREVRYDGGHKRNSFAVDLLGQVFVLVPVCPEVGAGMGVPREPVHLEAAPGGTRMVGNQSGTDHTDAMTSYTADKIEELADENLRGFILKSGSPSCGMEVDVEGSAQREPGLFARVLAERFPGLPVIEEGGLEDGPSRQNFAERVFAYDRQMRFFGGERSVGQLVMSHAQTKLQLDAHRPGLHAEVSEIFTSAAELSYEELGARYLREFMQAIATPATQSGHFAVLKSVFDGIRKDLEPPVQKELARALQDYRQGNVPLGVPLTLLRHYVRIQEHPVFNQQTYLEPEPRELLLRTQI